MENWQKAPLTVGQVLDVTFSVIKENFAKLYLILFIFMGPYYVLMLIGSLVDGLPLLPEGTGGGIQSLLQGFSQPGTQSAYSNPASLGYVMVGSILTLLAIPVSHASIMILAQRAGNKETAKIGSVIKQAFSRYWALLGASIVFGLVIYGISIGMTIIIISVAAVGNLAGMFSGQSAFGSAGPGTIVTTIVLIIIALASLIYLTTRWSLFFPATVFEQVSPGLGKSWRLTRGHFWRLLGLYFIMSVIYIFLFSIPAGVTGVFLRGSIMSVIVNALFAPIVSAIPTTANAIIYFDLLVRNEAADLQQLLETYQENPNSNKFVTTGVANPLNTQSLVNNPENSGTDRMR